MKGNEQCECNEQGALEFEGRVNEYTFPFLFQHCFGIWRTIWFFVVSMPVSLLRSMKSGRTETRIHTPTQYLKQFFNSNCTVSVLLGFRVAWGSCKIPKVSVTENLCVQYLYGKSMTDDKNIANEPEALASFSWPIAHLRAPWRSPTVSLTYLWLAKCSGYIKWN